MSAQPITCSNNSVFPFRFYDHCKLGLKNEIQAHDKNWTEIVGDKLLWPWQNVPGKLWALVTDPRVVTIAITAFALIANSYMFYPVETPLYLNMAWEVLPTVPLWTIKFAAYLFCVETIAAYAIRAEGRFWNGKLMDQFYGRQVNQTL